jgi:hypothetical protein
MRDPVVQVVSEGDGAIVYTLRIAGDTFVPKVFALSLYTLHVGEPGTDRMQTLEHIPATPQSEGVVRSPRGRRGSTLDRGPCRGGGRARRWALASCRAARLRERRLRRRRAPNVRSSPIAAPFLARFRGTLDDTLGSLSVQRVGDPARPACETPG